MDATQTSHVPLRCPRRTDEVFDVAFAPSVEAQIKGLRQGGAWAHTVEHLPRMDGATC